MGTGLTTTWRTLPMDCCSCSPPSEPPWFKLEPASAWTLRRRMYSWVLNKGTIGAGCLGRTCLLIPLLAKRLGPRIGSLVSIRRKIIKKPTRLTSDPKLMFDEPHRDVLADLDGLPWHLPLSCPPASLASAVVQEHAHPSFVLANDSAPEKVSICSHVAGPLVGESLGHPRQLNRLWIDLSHRQLGPVGDVQVLRDLMLGLDDLLSQQQLVHEIQGAVPFSWQEKQL